VHTAEPSGAGVPACVGSVGVSPASGSVGVSPAKRNLWTPLMFISAILLAAGSATRMGADKLLLPYQGRRLIDRALAPLAACPLVDEVLVVVRPDFPPLLANREGEAPAEPPTPPRPHNTIDTPLAYGPKCRLIVNPDHQEGMGTSLRTGVRAASPAADAFVVALADMPDLTVEIVTTLIEAFCRSGKQILVPAWAGRNGHPVVFAAACRDDLLCLTGDAGARALIAAHPERVAYLPVPHRAVIHDVDTPADIA
jgi:CTP:molybdopterin cytidylyltransferase MocA